MHRVILKSLFLSMVLAVTVGVMPAAFAQAEKCGQKRNVPTQALDELTWKQLNTIYEYVGEERYDEAFERLETILGRASRNTYLQAVVHQGLAQVEWARKNYESALRHFEKAVELNTLPDQSHFALMYQIAQLYFMKDRFQDAIDALDLWFCKVPAEEVTSHAWVLKASIHAQQKDYASALKAIDTAIAMDEKPQESWYQLKLASHFELKQFPQAAQTLELMIGKWPDKKSYWTQLGQIYSMLKQEDKSLAVMALAHRKQLLDSKSDLMFLSGLYASAGVPFKAAEVLEQGIRDGVVEGDKRHWTMVGETWYLAEEMERALEAFKQAGEVASEGDIDLRRGFIMVDMEDWAGAQEALSSAIEKGGLNDHQTGEAYLLRGMARFNLGQFDAASSDWGKASRFEKTRSAAQQWINHLQEERRRRA